MRVLAIHRLSPPSKVGFLVSTEGQANHTHSHSHNHFTPRRTPAGTHVKCFALVDNRIFLLLFLFAARAQAMRLFSGSISIGY